MLDFIYSYTYWHYTSAVKALLFHARNFVVFLWTFFAIPGLLATLLSPWQRLQESYDSGFDIKEKLATFIVNSLMRLVGGFVRIVMILFGAAVLVLSMILLLLVTVIWFLLPAVFGILIVVMLNTLL
ncbi:MAG: hypothetical protein WD335_02965 [Candidatus Paceibacterota bacterium]